MSKTCTKRYASLLDTEHLKGDLKGKSIRGGLSSMTAEVLSSVLRIGSTVALARMLLPEDFGLISMVTALTVFAERFKDLGLDVATVQRREITHEQVSTLFWINVGIGLIIMFTVAALSPAVAWFYNNQCLIAITLALSISFLFGGLSIQHLALLRRQMRFAPLAWIQVVSTALSVALGIALAWRGFVYWALVWKEVSRPAFMAGGAWLMCRWRPGVPKLRSGIGSMVRLGRDVTGFNVVYFLSRSLDQILIGRFWGAGSLGLYRQAYQLLMMPMTQVIYPLNSVAVPALTSLQDEPEKFRRYYGKAVSILSFATMPVVVYIGIFSDNFVRLLLGDRWIQSAGILRALAIGAFIQPIANTCGLVMVSCGKTKRYFWWGAMNAISAIVAFGVGIFWGPIGVAIAYAVVTYAILIPCSLYAFKDTPISISLFFRSVSSAAVSSLMMGLLLVVIQCKTSFLGNITEMVVSLFLAIIVYCGVWLLLPEGIQQLREYLSYPLALFRPAPSSARKNT